MNLERIILKKLNNLRLIVAKINLKNREFEHLFLIHDFLYTYLLISFASFFIKTIDNKKHM